jgi:hypothetical protein
MSVYTVTFSGINRAAPSTAVGVPTMANAANALILYVTGLGTFGARSPPTAPAGYGASIAPNVNSPDIAIYPRIAVAANESPGSINWSSANSSYAYAVILTPPVGYTVPALASILDVPGTDWSTTSVSAFSYFTSIVPVTAGDLLLGIGQRIKTTATNGATIGSMSHDTAFGAPLFTNVGTGVGPAVVVNGWQQTTPTATNASDAQVMSIAESSGLNGQTVFLALAAPVPIGSLGVQFSLRAKRRIVSTVSYRR